MKSAFGQYRLVSELGRGGMGVVYKAHDAALDRHVAIKVLADTLAHDPRVVERFQREARAVAALDDAHVVHVYAIGSANDLPYFAMEFVDGVSLDALLKRERHLAPNQAARLIVQAARGLACAHARGLVHRDVKPGNILISTAGVAKVSDFGIAQSSQDGSLRLTTTGAFLGTPGYLAPECYDGAAADARSDIFALGIVLFECLAGRLPYKSTSPLALMREVVDVPLPDIRVLNPSVDAELVRILERMTAKDPARRYPDCRELIDDLVRHFAIGADDALTVHVRHTPELPLHDVPTGTATQRLDTPFLQRLRNRKIVQWALAYLAAAFALLQGLDIVGQQFGWADGVRRGITVALAIGFFVAVVLAWYHGERGAQRVTGTELLILALLLAVGGGVLWRIAPGPARTDVVAAATVPPGGIPDKSIAVLPFENLSDDKSNAYFVAGMQDLILTKLAGIGDLKVIARASTAKYGVRPDDVKAIGQQLGVATILEGSVQRAGNQVLINVQLVDARSAAHLWAQDYTRTLDNLFGVEGEVAQKVADALKARLSPAETASLAAPPTTNRAALDLFLHAEYQANRGKVNSDTASLKAALPLYRQALVQDPRFALALARLSYVESELAWLNGGGGLDVKQLTAQARADAERALQLAPDLAEAHLAIGFSDYYGRGDYAAARAAFDAALALRPNDADALTARGYVERREGRFDAAIGSLQSALTRDPRNSALAADLGETCMMTARYADATIWLQRALALDPANINARIDLSNTLLLDTGDAQRALDAAQGDEPVLRTWRADLLIYLRRYGDAIALLQGVDDTPDNFSFVRGSKALQLANLYRLAGDSARAQPLFARAQAQARAELVVQQGSDLAYVWRNLASAELGLGRTQEGLDAIARSQAIVAAAGDSVAGPNAMVANAMLYAQAQRPDLAVPLLTTALASPGIGFYYSPAMLAIDPAWDPVRNDPRFQALLAVQGAATPSTVSQ
ncbi:MAG: protein kinase [Xanthomonadaceae bacterium]|nr:protein kinase [Xanthomonadaceae bacterium]